MVALEIYLTLQLQQQLLEIHKKPVKVLKLTLTRQKAPPLEAVKKIVLAAEAVMV
jgi:hypothetical protein